MRASGVSTRASSAGSASASRSSRRAGADPPASSSRCRNRARRRRSPTPSRPPNGVRSASASSSGSRSAGSVRARRTTPTMSRTTVSLPSGRCTPAALVGTSRAASSASSVATCRVSCAITAMRSQPMPCSRCHSRSVLAMRSCSSCGEPATNAATASAGPASAVSSPVAGARRWSTLPETPMVCTTVRVRAVSGGSCRCGRSSTCTSPSMPARRAKSSGPAPRKAPEEMSGSPNAITATPRARSAETRATPPAVSSCASSMSTTRNPPRGPSSVVSAVRRIAAASASRSAASRCAARARSRTPR